MANINVSSHFAIPCVRPFFSVYLLLSGDPSVIGIACSIVSDINSGKFNLLKWDRQEQMYYPLEINLHEKGKIDD